MSIQYACMWVCRNYEKLFAPGVGRSVSVQVLVLKGYSICGTGGQSDTQSRIDTVYETGTL